jgi:CBS domain-containing protein
LEYNTDDDPSPHEEGDATMTTVKDVLAEKGTNVWTIAPEAKVLDALKLMAEKDVGALAVTSKKSLVGILSERDYARKVILRGKSSLDTQVKDIMTTRVYYVAPETTTQECMAVMTKNRIRHLPVIRDEKLVGIISIGDIIKATIVQQKIAIDHLENYIMGKYL